MHTVSLCSSARRLSTSKSASRSSTDPDYSSLNLAQATLLMSYEIFLASQEEEGALPRGRRSTRPATVDELENTYAALEDGLHRIEFFKSRRPESILRTIRTVISRAEPDLQEAGLLRAIGYEIGYYLDRRFGSTETDRGISEEATSEAVPDSEKKKGD